VILHEFKCRLSSSSTSSLFRISSHMIKGLNDIFEAVHIVPVDVPVAEVAKRCVLNIPDIVRHDITTDEFLLDNSFF
jgi:hypothetical protein